jgi:Domain of unknown function (DUF5668)
MLNRDKRVVGPGIFVGLWITTLGVIFLLDQLGILPARVSFQFVWPLILIVAGLATIFSNRFWGSLFLGIGTVLVANELGFVHVRIGSLWPLILIALGVWMLLGSYGTFKHGPGWGEWQDWHQIHDSVRNSVRDSMRDAAQSCNAAERAAPEVNSSRSDDSTFDQSVVLSGFKRRVTSRLFRYGKVVAVLGGFQLDFTRADIDGDVAQLRIETVFGGGEVRVPDTWRIAIEAQAVAGAFVDETSPPPEGAGPSKRLVVRGAAVFGGVTFKN